MIRQTILKANQAIAHFSYMGAICISFSFHIYLILFLFSFKFSIIYLILNTIVLLTGIYFIYQYLQQIKQKNLHLQKHYTSLRLVK